MRRRTVAVVATPNQLSQGYKDFFMTHYTDDDLAVLKRVAEDPTIAPSRRVRARKVLKLINARDETAAGQAACADIIDVISATEDGAS